MEDSDVVGCKTNLRCIERRQAAREIDEREFEHFTLAEERWALEGPRNVRKLKRDLKLRFARPRC